MPAITALLRGGFRCAATALLALAVLLAGTGMHPAEHCSDHGAEAPALPAGDGPADPHDDGGDGLCFTCDCSCQVASAVDLLEFPIPVWQPRRLVQADRPLTPDEVVIEVEPPPVRGS